MQLTLAETREEMEVLYPGEGEPVNSIPLDDPISPLDQLQIRAIEWVSLANSEDLLLDTLINGNIVFRRFLRTPTPHYPFHIHPEIWNLTQ
jgi:hypothetical protein